LSLVFEEEEKLYNAEKLQQQKNRTFRNFPCESIMKPTSIDSQDPVCLMNL